MSKIVRIISRGTYANSIDLAKLQERYKEKLKGITVCYSNSDGEVASCIDYSIYYTECYWEGNIPAGGIKLIDEQQNGSGMANQGGTDWKEGADLAQALIILARILFKMSGAEKIEIVHVHP